MLTRETGWSSSGIFISYRSSLLSPYKSASGVLPLAAVAFAQCKLSSVINSQLTLLGDDDVAVPKAVSLLSQQGFLPFD